MRPGNKDAGKVFGNVSEPPGFEGEAVIARLPGAVMRALLVMWLVATPSLLLPGVSTDATQIAMLVAVFSAAIILIEYCSTYPSLVEFRHAPPFNRVRFLSLFLTVILLTLICRGWVYETPITQVITIVGSMVGHLIDFPYSPVRNFVLMLPYDAPPLLVESVRTAAGMAYLAALVSLAVFLVILRLDGWPRRHGDFNVWVNLPTFDPTAGGDAVERLQRDARFNIALGFLLPFVIPAVLKAASYNMVTLSLETPQTLIWTVSAWAFLPTSLFMRGIAMGRVAAMIEEKRRRRYAEFGEEGVLA